VTSLSCFPPSLSAADIAALCGRQALRRAEHPAGPKRERRSAARSTAPAQSRSSYRFKRIEDAGQQAGWRKGCVRTSQDKALDASLRLAVLSMSPGRTGLRAANYSPCSSAAVL
jgi:hypothetical protein